MWHAYNLIAVGDELKATTVRKVQRESSTGSVDSQRVRTVITVRVLDVDFDVDSCALRVKGRNVAENPHVKMGAHHTLEMELNRKMTLRKDVWDSIALERLEMACDPTRTADLAAVVMKEGLAHVCLVTPSMTLLRCKVEKSIPRKRAMNESSRAKAVNAFFQQTLDAIARHIDFSVVKAVLVASPGFVRERFLEYIWSRASASDAAKALTAHRSSFIGVHASSGHMHSLKEVLADASVAARLSDTKAAGEVAALNRFYETMNVCADKAFYGPQHVMRAAEVQAIDELLVSDALFRSRNLGERERYVALVDEVRAAGGTVRIFSSLHQSGQQLGLLSGVAALLRYPMPDLEDEAGEEGSGSSGSSSGEEEE